MSDIVGVLALLLGLFLVCFAIAQAVAARRHGRVKTLDLAPNVKVRILGPRGAHQCHFIREEPDGLVFLAPLNQDRYVPIRPGESLMVQVPDPAGVTCFRSAVQSRNAITHEFTLSRPTTVRRVNRRSEPRDKSYAGSAVTVNGGAAKLVNLSSMGARVLAQANIQAGDLMWVQLPGGMGEAQGWALDVRESSIASKRAIEVRIAFSKAVEALRVGPKLGGADVWADAPIR